MTEPGGSRDDRPGGGDGERRRDGRDEGRDEERDDGHRDGEHREDGAAGAAVHSSAWEATIEDMLAMAEEMEANGWDTVTVTAGDTAAEAPSDGDSDRFGLSHVIPDNEADAFREAFADRQFPRYEVYRAERGGRSFVLTVLLDPESATAVLLAGTYELRTAGGCIRAAVEADAMFTHVGLLDGTHLGSVRHENYEKFFSEDVLEEHAAVDDAGEGGDASDGESGEETP